MNAPPSAEPIEPSTAPGPKRRRLPRFGLRALFVFAILFCLFFGWLGRNWYRVRQEDAAIEALQQAGASILMRGGDVPTYHPATRPGKMFGRVEVAEEDDRLGRLLGYADRSPIRHVNLTGNDPADEKMVAALSALPALSEVESVNLTGDAFDDDAMAHVARAAGLASIGLFQTNVTREGLAKLGPPARLERIHFNPGASPGLASGLTGLTELREINLSGLPMQSTGRLTRADLEAIAGLPKLESLSVMHFPAVEAGLLEPLTRSQSLRTLQVMGVPLKDDDLSAIAKVPGIETLRIGGVTVEGLAKLGSMPTLKSIDISGPASPVGALAFSKANPECLVGFATYSSNPQWFRGGEEIDPPSDAERLHLRASGNGQP